jgi:hypothetical protein
VPSEWSQATAAAQALAGCIVKMRDKPWMNGMRTAAIAGLGKLKVESSGPILIEELTDDNPAIAREAVRSAEKALGLSVTVARIAEAAARHGAGATDAYGGALRWLKRDVVADELERLMGTGSATQQEVARNLLRDLGGAVAFAKLRARTDVMKEYTSVLKDTEERIQGLFESSLVEAKKGFHLAVIMDVVVFGLGVLLLLASAGFALFKEGGLDKWAGIGLTTGGVLGVVYGVLIANPRKQVRESVDHLMRLKMVFLAYLRRLHQADQAYSRMLIDDKEISVDDVRAFSAIVGGILVETIAQPLDANMKTLVAAEPRAGSAQPAKPAGEASRVEPVSSHDAGVREQPPAGAKN